MNNTAYLTNLFRVGSSIFLLACFQSANAEKWLLPMVKFQNLVSDERELDMAQAAEAAIWNNSPKTFVCRLMVPAFPALSEEIRIYTLVKLPSGDYSSEVIGLSLREGKWSLEKQFKSKVSSEDGLKCWAIFRKHIIAARFPEGSIGSGLDVPIVLWDCLNEDDSSVHLQALEFSQPSDELTKKDNRFVLKVLMEN